MTNLIVLTRVLIKGLTSWNTKIFLESSRYRHKQNIKYKNTNLLTRTFTRRYVFSVISQKIYSAKVSCCQDSDIRGVSIALV